MVKLNESIINNKEIKNCSNILLSILEDVKLKCYDKKHLSFSKDHRFLICTNTLELNDDLIEEFSVTYHMYILPNKTYYEYFRPNATSYALPTMEMTIVGVYFREDEDLNNKDLLQIISHEYHHLYQYYCGYKNHRGDFYTKVVRGCSLPNETIKDISQCLYMSFKNEEDAHLAQLYQDLIVNTPSMEISYGQLIELNPNIKTFFAKFEYVIDILERIDGNPKDFIESYFNMSCKTISKFIIRSEQRYLQKLKKVFAKYLDHIQGEPDFSNREHIEECKSHRIKENELFLI